MSLSLPPPNPSPPPVASMRCSAEDIGLIRAAKVAAWLRKKGIQKRDPRVKGVIQHLLAAVSDAEDALPCQFGKETVEKLFSATGSVFLLKVLRNELVVKDFAAFSHKIERIFEQAKQESTGGELSRLTPELSQVDPDLWGVSLCTVDGQRLSLGDSRVQFCLQGCSRPITYAWALTEKGPVTVHQFVGYEPVGEHHEGLEIGPDGKPFNPLTSSGALVTAALIGSAQDPISVKFTALRRVYSRLLAGSGSSVSVHTGAYLSQREANHRDWAVAHRLLELNAFPPGVRVADAMDLHLQLCAFSLDCDAGALVAAALANGGVSPLTEERVLSPDAARSCLSVMHSCGLGQLSGRFAFKCGLPAVCGAAGCLMAVLPNAMGICLYSPRLAHGRASAKALRFCELLVQSFSFHLYDSLLHNRKPDPTSRGELRTSMHAVSTMLYAAKQGNIACLRRFYLTGHNMNSCDYDTRTPLHVAASEGHLDACQFLCDICRANRHLQDRWGFTARDCARILGHSAVEEYLAGLDAAEPQEGTTTGCMETGWKTLVTKCDGGNSSGGDGGEGGGVEGGGGGGDFSGTGGDGGGGGGNNNSVNSRAWDASMATEEYEEGMDEAEGAWARANRRMRRLMSYLDEEDD